MTAETRVYVETIRDLKQCVNRWKYDYAIAISSPPLCALLRTYDQTRALEPMSPAEQDAYRALGADAAWKLFLRLNLGESMLDWANLYSNRPDWAWEALLRAHICHWLADSGRPLEMWVQTEVHPCMDGPFMLLDHVLLDPALLGAASKIAAKKLASVQSEWQAARHTASFPLLVDIMFQ